MLKKFITLVVVLALIWIGFAFIREENDPVVGAINRLAKPVPVGLVVQLAGCIATDTCQLPRKKLLVGGTELWAVQILDKDSDIIFSTDGSTLKVMVTTHEDGKEWPILVEDTGTGMVSRIIRLDERTRRAQILTANDRRFADELPAAQALYYLVMKAAEREIVPGRSGPTT